MQILALETSTGEGSCALWRDGEIREKSCPPGLSHSETLLPLVRELLAEAGTTVGALDAVAFGVGPGAFTGLRVACGAAQGLAVGGDLPLYPVGSLETMAAASGGGRVLSLLDARMGEVYHASFDLSNGLPARLDEIRVQAPGEIALPVGSGWLACGNALAVYPELASRLHAAGVMLAATQLPSAAWVARLAAARRTSGEAGIDAAQAAPLYVRDKVARTVAERLGEGGRA